MKEVKILGTVLVFTVFVSITMLFFGFYSEGGARIDFFPARDSGGGDVLGLTLLLSCIIGGIFGSIVGILSGIYLIVLLGVHSKLKVPITITLGYAVFIGCLVSLLLFFPIWGRNSTYSSLIVDLRHEWLGLTMYFIFGFISAFLPVIVAKKFFDL
jgi:hypothetical protein